MFKHCKYRIKLPFGRSIYERSILENGDFTATSCSKGCIVRGKGGGIESNNSEHDMWSLNDKRKQTKSIKCLGCGAKMILKTSMQGRSIGKQFYGCSNYPICKETEDYPYRYKAEDLTPGKRMARIKKYEKRIEEFRKYIDKQMEDGVPWTSIYEQDIRKRDKFINDFKEGARPEFPKFHMSNPTVAVIDYVGCPRSIIIFFEGGCEHIGSVEFVPRPESIEARLIRLNKQLNLYEKRLTDLNRLQNKHSKHSRTKAAAASHFEKSRELAVQIRKRLKKQYAIYQNCPYCIGALGNDPHADHIYPVSRGGLSTEANMIFVCQSCNIKKRDMTLRDFIKKNKLDRDSIENVLEKLGKEF